MIPEIMKRRIFSLMASNTRIVRTYVKRLKILMHGPLRSRVKSSVRFRTGGDVFSPRTDVVIDDIVMTQWCAANFNDSDISDFTHDPLLRSGCPTNFVYVNGWVNVSGEAHTVDLQPTRAQAGR